LRILVTGGYGFIGSNFIKYMLNKYNDIRIINVDNLSYGSNISNLKEIEDDRRYGFVKGSINDIKLMNSMVKEVDAIVNFAAESHVDRSIVDPQSFFKSNVEGVLAVLEAIRSSGKNIRFIQISSDEVYGDILKGSFREDDRIKPSSPYAASKACADLLCLAYYRTYGINISITRCTNNFGPYQFPEKLIPKTVIRAMLNLKVPVYGTGKNVRDWIYVLDHCEAIDRVLFNGRAGEIYNVSSGNELTNIHVVEKILDLLNKPRNLIEFVEDRPGHDIRYSLNSNKIFRELGWKPRHRFEDALKSTIEWYVENEWWWKPLADERILHPTPWKLKW